MEDIQIRETNLTVKSSTCYKMVIPKEVENKIRFICQRVPNVEWSGTLFFTYEGSFENNDLIIRCVDIYIMDIGNATYTEFAMNPDVVSYMTEHPELLDCQLGLLHSHAGMPTFFSGTDVATLKEEGNDRNNFVSLIVNNVGTYSAAITRMVKSKTVREEVSYEFFSEGEKSNIIEYSEDTKDIEWFYLDIIKEGESLNYSDIEDRLNEINEAKKKSKSPINKYKDKFTGTVFTQCKENINSSPFNISSTSNTVKSNTQTPIIDRVKDQDSEFESIPYGEVSVDTNIINSLVKQLVTCSIILPNESKIDIEKWARNMNIFCEKRFGKGEYGMKVFKEWADPYIEFLTWNINDENLTSLGIDQLSSQSLCAYDLSEALSQLPQNAYIETYIEELEKYII